MKYLCFLSLLFLSVSISLRANEELAEKAETFFRDLKKASPALYEQLQQEKDLFQRIAQHLVPDMIPADRAPQKQPQKKAPLYPAKLVAKNTIFYARVDRIDEESLQNLIKEMRITARIANRPIGAVLDLRSAASGDFPSVARFVALFTQKPDKKPHFFQKIPVAVICGAKTNGPAELLTILLERSKLGISLGEKGAGSVFPRKEVELAGQTWLVPEIPDFAKDISPGAHTPMIECAAYPQISFEQIGKLPIESDHAIRRAADLLHSLHAIRGK